MYQLYLAPEYDDQDPTKNDMEFVKKHRVRLCSHTELVYEGTPIYNAYVPVAERLAAQSNSN